MKRLLAAVAGSVALLAGVATAEATSGAHFMPATDANVADNGALVLTIDEAGVGNATVSYVASWSATANYGCVNGGGNHPKASNKETVQAAAAAGFTEEPKNGRVQATETVAGTPPPVPTDFSCPGGQVLVLADVTYSVNLADTTNGANIDLTASRVFFQFGK
jgi:hypothetical protein